MMSYLMNILVAFGARIVAIAVVIGGIPTPANSQESVPQQVLRFEVQRFAMSYATIMGQAFDQLEQKTEDPAIRTRIQNKKRDQTLASVNIALGESPGANLLDIVVLAALSRTAIDQYWAPTVFGRKESRGLVETYANLENAAWDFAGRYLTSEQIARFRGLVDGWRKTHSDVRNVEFLRINQFLDQVSTRERTSSVGLLSFLLPSVGETGQAIDRATVLGERAMTLAQFYPLLVHQEAKHFLYELLAEEDVRRLLAQSTTLTGEVTRFNQIVDTMPDKVAQQVTLQRVALMQDIDERQETFGKIVAQFKETVGLARDLAQYVENTAGLVVPVVERAQAKGFTAYDVVQGAKEALKEANLLAETVNRMLVEHPTGNVAETTTQLVKDLNTGLEQATNRIFLLLLLLVPFTVFCCVLGVFGYRLLARWQFGSPT
jgi:hypothetical protein